MRMLTSRRQGKDNAQIYEHFSFYEFKDEILNNVLILFPYQNYLSLPPLWWVVKTIFQSNEYWYVWDINIHLTSKNTIIMIILLSFYWSNLNIFCMPRPISNIFLIIVFENCHCHRTYFTAVMCYISPSLCDNFDMEIE